VPKENRMSPTLYSYYRSSAAFRVRIALNLKGVHCTIVPVNLLAGEQRSDRYRAINPQGLVPALALADGRVITQSGAILEFLESSYPQPPLLPGDPYARARVRSLCNVVACDIHPLNNLRVLDYLVRELGASEEQKTAWYHRWLAEGFASLEQQVDGGDFAHGDAPGMADVYLVPQIYNALRLRFDITPFPRLARIYGHCTGLAAFAAAHPDAQPDRPA